MDDISTALPTSQAEPIVGHCRACRRDLTEAEIVPHPVISLPGMTHNVDDCPCGRLQYEAYILCETCKTPTLERDLDDNGNCAVCAEFLASEEEPDTWQEQRRVIFMADRRVA
jgi:hypothetical protein